MKVTAIDQNQEPLELLGDFLDEKIPGTEYHAFLSEEEALSATNVRVKTFGSFDLFVNGGAVPFRRERAKEMLAYLVDRRGSLVTRKELSSILFEDHDYSRSTQTYITQIIQSLRNTLKEAKLEDLFVVEYNGYAVNTQKFSCDSYDYLDGKKEAQNLFHGEYMSQYSWGEEQLYQFEN